MLGLLDQMEAENPEDPSLAPKASVYQLDNVPAVIFTYSLIIRLADFWGVGLCLC